MGGLEDAGPTAEGAGRLAQETTVGSTLCTGVEEASGVFTHTHRGRMNIKTICYVTVKERLVLHSLT